MQMVTSFSSLPNVQVVDLATSFSEGADLLEAAGGNAIPIANLRLHAIELYLKSLHVTDAWHHTEGGIYEVRARRSNQGHDLVASFSLAKPEHQARIKADLPAFEDDLAQLRGGFMQSRYLYETAESLPIGTTRKIARHLQAVVPQLRRLVAYSNQVIG